MPTAPRKRRPLALRIRECGTDMATRSRRVLYHGCCTCCSSCCCVWSLSGLATGLIAYGASTSHAEALVGPGARNVRRAAVKGMFAGFFIGLLLTASFGKTALLIGVICAAPALLLCAAIGGYLSSRLCAEETDEVEHLIAQRVVSRALGTMAVGAIVGTLYGLAPCLLIIGKFEAGMSIGLVATIGATCFAAIRSDTILSDGAIPRRAIAARSKRTGSPGVCTLTPSKVAPTGIASSPAVTEQDLILFIDNETVDETNQGVSRADEAIHCPVCGGVFAAEDELFSCQRCETPHHKACWEYNVGCAIFGCGSAATTTPIEVDYAELKGLAFDWFWASRLRWWASVAAALFLAAAPIVYAFPLTKPHLFPVLHMALLSITAFVIMSLPALNLRSKIHKLVSEQLEPSETVVTQLVRRFKESRSETLLQRMGYSLPLIYPLIAMIVLILVWQTTGPRPFEPFVLGAGLVIGELACLFIVQRAQRRQIVIESITGRILASERSAQRQLDQSS